ncbi:hypothetical protein [Massilia glaciei]|uniref:Uncharacterized protein n=1 Tax=Massilia glaciei TaxID=1524097 RepID=A0A2U2I529_9BURK|nr:hypothetical protein [Massilia glaciei]PWF54715.1 hypothetical protein C7C56_005555 [Massilia glaciei]
MMFQSISSPAIIAAFITSLTFPCASLAGPEATERWAPQPPRGMPGESCRAHGAAAIKQQDHGDAVNFRNKWIRPLDATAALARGD